ncbi:MAG: ATP-binding protein [Candidatus Odinarchaeota archaeon]
MENNIIQVLLVEDNPIHALDVKMMLTTNTETLPVNLVHVERLEFAFERLDNTSFDVILLDLALPDSKRLVTLDRMLVRAPNVPIIVLTGFMDEAIALESVRKGAQEYLIKGSFDGKLLNRSIRYAIERKEIEKKLVKSEELFKSIAEMSREIIFRAKPNGYCTYINSAGASFFGKAAAELIGTDISTFFFDEGNKGMKSIFESILYEKGQITGLINTLLVPMGIRAVEWNASPIKDDYGNIVEIQASGRDVTEHQEEIIEKEKLAAVGQLAAGVAHELNTPLSNVGLTAEYLLDIIEENQESINKDLLKSELVDIKIQLGICSKIVKGLLQFSKKIDLIRSNFAVKPLLKEIIESPATASRMIEKHIKLMMEVEDDIEMFGDRILIHQAFQNIFNNAIDAWDEGKKNHWIKVISTRQGSSVVTKIIDNGFGIDHKEIDRVFEPFYSTKIDMERLGLGLSISKSIIEKHKGNISIKSVPGKETEVIVRLPAV